MFALLLGRTCPRPRCIKFWSSRAPCATRAQHTNLEVQGFCPVSKRLSGKRGSSSTQAAPAGKPFAVPQGSLHCAFPHLCVRQLSHGLQAVRIEDPAPKVSQHTVFLTTSHPSSVLQAFRLPAAQKTCPYLRVSQEKSITTKAAGIHCTQGTALLPLLQQLPAPRLLARQHGLRGFKGLKRFLSSVPLERDTAALPSASTLSRTASS